MPVDHYRVGGPIDETKAVFNQEKVREEKKRVLLKSGKRLDGRAVDEIRKIFLHGDAVTKAKGSAYIEVGKTKVICSIYGPRESTRRQEFRNKGKIICDVKFAPFSCQKRRSPIRDSEEKELSNILIQALEPAIILEKFPKAELDIYVIILENDGNVLSTVINCACVALVHSGIDMYDLVTSCSMVQSDTCSLLDPTYSEERSYHSRGIITVAFLPVLNQVSVLDMDGQLSLEDTKKATRMCIEGCARIYPVLHKCITNHSKTLLNK